MLLYPLISVAAQELVYRTFYFHRYGPLFGEQRWLGILLNGLLFGFAHIVVGTQFAIAATCASGLLFALRYSATRSFWAVFVEHTLWGWLVFTVGSAATSSPASRISDVEQQGAGAHEVPDAARASRINRDCTARDIFRRRASRRGSGAWSSCRHNC